VEFGPKKGIWSVYHWEPDEGDWAPGFLNANFHWEKACRLVSVYNCRTNQIIVTGVISESLVW